LLQGHAAVPGYQGVAPEGGFDFSTVLCYRRRACWIHDDDAAYEVVQTLEVLAPEVVGAP